MPSYADQMAARRQAAAQEIDLGGNSSSSNSSATGPVRLTISRGEAVVGPNGETRYEELWEQEEIMDTELVSSVDEELGGVVDVNGGFPDHSKTSSTGAPTIGLATSLQDLGGALLVLDTNTLLSALDLLKTLFAQCLLRNVTALENRRFDRSPISLIIPHTVIAELDGLKSMRSSTNDQRSKSAASSAQVANHFILNSLRLQKRQTYKREEQTGLYTTQNIPESAWALHVESSAHANSRAGGKSVAMLSNDEEIVRFCVSLKVETGLQVSFCSDDVNARLRAESDALLSFSLRDLMDEMLANSTAPRQEALEVGAGELIEQWEAQLGMASATNEALATGHTSTINHAAGSTSDAVMDTDEVAKFVPEQSLSSLDKNGRSIKDSVYAKAITSTARRKSSPVRTRRQHSFTPVQSTTGTHHDGDENSYEYPADRSSASSRWAAKK